MRLKRYAAVSAVMAVGAGFVGIPAASADPPIYPGCHGAGNVAPIAWHFGGMGHVDTVPPGELGELQQAITAMCNPKP
jgi:hypothetical protein